MELDRAAVDLVQHAVRHGDVLGFAAAEAEHRPARAERGVRDRDELAAPEQRAGIVLRLDVAVADGDVFGADEMEAVVVAIDAVVDVEAVHVDVLALDDADAVIRALEEPQIPDAQVFASTAKMSAQLPSPSVGSPRSGIASTAWYCFPSALPSSVPAAATCSVT